MQKEMEEPVVCFRCKALKRSTEELKIHISWEHLDYRPFQCSYCPRVFRPTEIGMELHISEAHPDKEFEMIYKPNDKKKAQLVEEMMKSSQLTWSQKLLATKQASSSNSTQCSSEKISSVGSGSTSNGIQAAGISISSEDRLCPNEKARKSPGIDRTDSATGDQKDVPPLESSTLKMHGNIEENGDKSTGDKNQSVERLICVEEAEKDDGIGNQKNVCSLSNSLESSTSEMDGNMEENVDQSARDECSQSAEGAEKDLDNLFEQFNTVKVVEEPTAEPGKPLPGGGEEEGVCVEYKKKVFRDLDQMLAKLDRDEAESLLEGQKKAGSHEMVGRKAELKNLVVYLDGEEVQKWRGNLPKNPAQFGKEVENLEKTQRSSGGTQVVGNEKGDFDFSSLTENGKVVKEVKSGGGTQVVGNEKGDSDFSSLTENEKVVKEVKSGEGEEFLLDLIWSISASRAASAVKSRCYWEQRKSSGNRYFPVRKIGRRYKIVTRAAGLKKRKKLGSRCELASLNFDGKFEQLLSLGEKRRMSSFHEEGVEVENQEKGRGIEMGAEQQKVSVEFTVEEKSKNFSREQGKKCNPVAFLASRNDGISVRKGFSKLCKICHKLVYAKFKRHILLCHLKKPVWLCPYCKYSNTGNKFHLRNHILHQHPDKPVSYTDKRFKYAKEFLELMDRAFPKKEAGGSNCHQKSKDAQVLEYAARGPSTRSKDKKPTAKRRRPLKMRTVAVGRWPRRGHLNSRQKSLKDSHVSVGFAMDPGPKGRNPSTSGKELLRKRGRPRKVKLAQRSGLNRRRKRKDGQVFGENASILDSNAQGSTAKGKRGTKRGKPGKGV